MSGNNIIVRVTNFFIDHINEIKSYYANNNINELWETVIKKSFINNEASVLDWKRYLSQPDLVKARLITVQDACWHYLTYGRKENRKTFKLNSDEPYFYDFDWKKYLDINRDVSTLNEIETFTHWLQYGYSNKRTTDENDRYKLNESIKISENENTNNNWKFLIISIIKKSNVTIDDLLCYNISHLLNNGILRSDFTKNKTKENKLYYKLKLISDVSLTFYSNTKNIIQVNSTKNNVNYIIEKNVYNVELLEPTIFLYKNVNGFMLFLDDVYIYHINNYDYIQLISNNNYDLSINYPLSIENFDFTNWENVNYLLSTFPKMKKKYQLNICHTDPINVNNIDHIIEKTNCNYIYVEKPEVFCFNRGYTRNLYKYLSLSDNIMFSDIDIPIPNEILNDMVFKLNIEKYQVVKPYTNNIVYTNQEQKADWLKNYTFNYNHFKKFTSTLVNTSNKKLFTISGGIVVIKRNLLEQIGGFVEIEGYGYEDRFMDVHLLNIPHLKIFKFNNTLFHLLHNVNRNKLEESQYIIKMKENFCNRYYKCYWHREASKDLHEFCNHETKYLSLIEKFHQKTNADLLLYKKVNQSQDYSQDYITLKKLPF